MISGTLVSPWAIGIPEGCPAAERSRARADFRTFVPLKLRAVTTADNDPEGDLRPRPATPQVVGDCDRRWTCGAASILRDVNARVRPAVWLLISLALLIVAGLGLHALATLMPGQDLALVRDAAGDRTPLMTALAHGASWLGRSSVLVPAVLVIALAAILLRRPLDALALIVGIVGAIVIQNVDKALIGRPRPPVHRLEAVSGTSFPSGHATEATAFFLVLLAVTLSGPLPRWARSVTAGVTIVIVAAVALSRVYLGVHYPTDVVAGMLLGGSWGVLATIALRRPSGHSHLRS